MTNETGKRSETQRSTPGSCPLPHSQFGQHGGYSPKSIRYAQQRQHYDRKLEELIKKA